MRKVLNGVAVRVVTAERGQFALLGAAVGERKGVGSNVPYITLVRID